MQAYRVLVEKSCVELLRSCELNYFVVFRHPCVLISLKPYLPLKTFELVTLGLLHLLEMLVLLEVLV